MALNIVIAGAFLAMVAVFGVFLWQTLFASERPADGPAQTRPAYGQQQAGGEHAIGGTATPHPHNSTEEAIAKYTKWLAIFTLFLVLATGALFISGERNVAVASRSADAAKRRPKRRRPPSYCRTRPPNDNCGPILAPSVVPCC